MNYRTTNTAEARKFLAIYVEKCGVPKRVHETASLLLEKVDRYNGVVGSYELAGIPVRRTADNLGFASMWHSSEKLGIKLMNGMSYAKMSQMLGLKRESVRDAISDIGIVDSLVNLPEK